MSTCTSSASRREVPGRREPVARVSDEFIKTGHDFVHVRELRAAGETDSAILVMASVLDRVIVSADTDFGMLPAAQKTAKPSVILVREVMGLPPSDLVAMIVQHLDIIASDLDAGPIVAFGRKAIRVRPLPLP